MDARLCFEESYQLKPNNYAMDATRNCNVMLGNFDQIPTTDDNEQIRDLLEYLSNAQEIQIYTQNTAYTWKLYALVDTPVKEKVFIINGNAGNVGNSPSGWVAGEGGSGYRGNPPISVCVKHIHTSKQTEERNIQPDGEAMCFMAMEFDDYQLERVLSEHIKPVVQQNFGIVVKTSRDINRAGLIDNIIRDGILGSKLVIADLTHANNGAYWESGFAEGCGIPVIYICEKRIFNTVRTHFDTSHLMTVLWSIDKMDTFESDLIQTISNTIDNQ